MTRHNWQIAEVSDVGGPASIRRTYLEQRDVRRCLREAASTRPLDLACDVGCGYGRLTMVLPEFARRVVGFEREESLVREAGLLLPEIEFQVIEALDRLTLESAGADFAMSFTVLQHLNDAMAWRAVEEIKRIARDGFVLLVEETDPALGTEIGPDVQEGITKGRESRLYQQWMRPFRLLTTV